MRNRDSIKHGQIVRAWDFEKMEDRKDRYVEGVVMKIENNMVHLHIIKDTAFKIGSRTEVRTPLKLTYGDWEGRLEIVDENLAPELEGE